MQSTMLVPGWWLGRLGAEDLIEVILPLLMCTVCDLRVIPSATSMTLALCRKVVCIRAGWAHWWRMARRQSGSWPHCERSLSPRVI